MMVFSPLVADDLFLFAALAASALLGRASDDLVDPFKMRWKFIAAGMLLAGARRLCRRCIARQCACGSIRQRPALHFASDLLTGHTWLVSEQLQRTRSSKAMVDGFGQTG